jgi:hypothetical protein
MIKASQEVQQRAFARTTRPRDGKEFTPLDI